MNHELNAAAAAVDVAAVLGLSSSLAVSGVCLDSRNVACDDAFVALAGESSHGLAFVSQAKSNGASVVLLDASDECSVRAHADRSIELPAVLVEGLSSNLGALARAVYGDVDQLLSLVGVTGTDGKTSITHFIAQLLAGEQRAAVLGTVGNGFLAELEPATHTTADVFQLYRQLAALQRQGATAVAMEVSSHALHQDRVSGLQFKVAVLSNLGSDHLDYHGDLAAYAAAKALLFDARAERCVLNLDDAFGQKLLALRSDAITYSAAGDEGARWMACDCSYAADGIVADIHVAGVSRRVSLPILGAFNVANVLAACAVAEALGESVDQILARLPALLPVVGRAELLSVGSGARVVVDYAHTAQALAAILATLRDHFSGRVHCVFGCGGDRDPGKRPEMARAAAAAADSLVVTSDNPRSEDPQKIIDDVLAGIPEGVQVHVELDRARAIEHALQQAEAGDCVLIAGKGHEDYQVLADRTVTFSDHAEVLAWQAGAA